MSNETGVIPLRNLIKKKFRIPMYQRNYKWNKEVAKKLVEDIIDSYNRKIDKSLGLITLFKNNNNNDTIYDVIDGQQRFTTLVILLNILSCNNDIELSFERDETDERRKNAVNCIKCTECTEYTDVNRIRRNGEVMKKVLEDKLKYEENITKEDLKDYIMEKVIFLCSIVTTPPLEEFMNLNAYKTAFSISDHVRANLIALNSFHKDELEKDNINPILARCLSNHSYKTAVAILYNNIQEKLYAGEKDEKKNKEGKYHSIYDLLKESEIIIEPENESYINILFGGMLKDKKAKNYESGEITENLDFWIKMLQKLDFANNLLGELEDEFEQGDFHSFKQIDDYQKLTKKSFIREVFEGIDKDWDSQTLAKEIQKYSNVDSVIIRCLSSDSKKLANRYLEAFVHSEKNSETYKQADNEFYKKVKLPQMSMSEVVKEISGCGRYIIDRYEMEHRDNLNISIDIPPVLDLEDRENVNFGGNLSELNESDEISVGELFKYDIKIPVIQRDYCMGARITGENDFLSFLLEGFDAKEELSASTVLLSVSEENKEKILYIFDGQQRTFTIYSILKYCLGNTCGLKNYTFVGRCNEEMQNRGCGSPYSEKAVSNLNLVLEKKIKEEVKGDFANYIQRKVKLKVKIVNSVSGAEQFFMDINSGVALKPYEIYKAMLCDRLSKIQKGNVVRKIENKWLDFFYSYRKKYLGVSDIKENEEDEEELLEIRFLEQVIRFVYRLNHFGYECQDIWKKNNENVPEKQDNVIIKNSKKEFTTEEIPFFDEIESKGEMPRKLGYINDISEGDIKDVEKLMDEITEYKIEKTKPENENSEIVLETISLQTDSKKNGVRISRLTCEGNKQNILENKEYYVMQFIWSLADGNREILKRYYRYKDISALMKICDNDQIMRDIILTILGKNDLGDFYPYQYSYPFFRENNFYCGYNNHNGRYNDNITVKKKSIKGRYVKEIPAYYYDNKDNKDNKLDCEDQYVNVRLQYLQEKACPDNNDKELYFALVKDGFSNQIKCEDGDNSNICLLGENLEGYECTNRTEAYCLKYIDNKIRRVNNGEM